MVIDSEAVGQGASGDVAFVGDSALGFAVVVGAVASRKETEPIVKHA
jgi:hypothetical protein